jgi:hypothetical protein
MTLKVARHVISIGLAAALLLGVSTWQDLKTGKADCSCNSDCKGGSILCAICFPNGDTCTNNE